MSHDNERDESYDRNIDKPEIYDPNVDKAPSDDGYKRWDEHR